MSFNKNINNKLESSNNNDNSREKQITPVGNEIKTEDIKKEQLFLNFSFFKVDPKWRWLNEIGKEEAFKFFSCFFLSYFI